MTDRPRIAIACSGVGHIRRGIEAWAEDLTRALRRRGKMADLFGGAPGSGEALGCFRRTGFMAKTLAGAGRHFGGWRYGMGSPYEVEQLSFALSLWRRIRSDYDILHVQDPLIGRLMDQANRRGLSRPKVILANGTGEKPVVLSRFTHLQELTPQAEEIWRAPGSGADGPRPNTIHMVPNFIDVDSFTPGDQRASRRSLDLPENGIIILCSAAIRAYHKRIDHLLREFLVLVGRSDLPVTLVCAGGRESDTDAIVAEGERLLGDKVRFFVSLPRERMVDLYRSADIFVLPSLFETFGIVLLEAMATGLPVACHDGPGFRFVVGPAGLFGPFDKDGGIGMSLEALLDTDRRQRLARLARPHVIATFGEAAVTDQIIRMYDDVLAS